MNCQSLMITALILCATTANADWTTIRGNTQRTGYIDAEIKAPFHVAWVRHFAEERLGTAMEPIVAEGKLFVATHSGNLYALDALTGEPIWNFKAKGALLHSPAFADNIIVAASTDGYLYALDGDNGEIKWSFYLGNGGSSASPTIVDGRIFVGTRRGDFFAVELKTGEQLWRKSFNAPIRQTASYHNGKVYFTGEDMIARCLDSETGDILWTSETLVGQTARDYYPVIANGQVIIRTNPTINMTKLIGQDRHILCESAGVDDSGWQTIDAWTKSQEAMGSLELWEKEQATIVNYLKEHPEDRTFFMIDADGKQMEFAPVLWCAGCQGCGSPPVVMPDGKLMVFYRSAYGNWNHGVAPLVALGMLDPLKNRVELLTHKHGMQPPWNTFWGTADEGQNFVVAGKTLLIIHQGTLSGFNLDTGELFLIAGNRDSWGGFHNLPWARNEWHGPARGGVAVVGNRIYWLTGSRVMCVVCGEKGRNAQDIEIDIKANSEVIEQKALDHEQIKQMLAKSVNEFLSDHWSPFLVEPGLADRDFAFDNSGNAFEALAMAFPHLAKEHQDQIKDFLEKEWESYPPYKLSSFYDLDLGKRREYFSTIPAESLTRANSDQLYHPFGNMYAIKLYAERCGEWDRVLSEWQSLKTCFDDFAEQPITDKEIIYANRYLASLIAYADIAEKSGGPDSSAKAKKMIEERSDRLISMWKRSSENMDFGVFKDISEWDGFIGEGDTLFFKVKPHRAMIALFHNLTPEVAHILNSNIQEEANKVWRAFETLCPTWYLVGEERQVHYGENFVDLPDFSMDAFRATAWLQNVEPLRELNRRFDIPLCRADLNYIIKLSIILEQSR